MSKAVHAKSKRRAFYKGKRKELAYVPKETLHFCAIDFTQMSKTMLAFYKVAHKRNNIKPDSSSNRQSPTKAQPSPVPVKRRNQRKTTRSASKKE